MTVRKTAVRIFSLVVLALGLMGVEQFSCKEKVEVALLCEPLPVGPVKCGLGELAKAMEGANLVPRPIRPDSKKVDARYLLAVGVVGRDKWLDPYVAAAKLSVPNKPESFAGGEYRRKERRTIVFAGSDPVGLMYGLFELSDIITSHRADPQRPLDKVSRSPFIEVRGVNPFLSLPMAGEREWWFHSEDFWRTYLDLLARARVNFLDLHGMYDVVKTSFPNVYPYFMKSDRFPEVGESAEEAGRNLAMLNKVIALAKNRGIRVGIMSYSAGTRTAGGGPAMRRETEENLAEYTRAAVARMIKACPDLAVIGFRIGESGRREDFYRKSYLPGIADASSKIGLYTRTWGAKYQDIVDVGQKYRERFDVEIKYNGEQLGAPYIVAGGRMAGWRDYSYQNYLGYPRPYRVIWQIRANGTHRIFHWGDPRFVKRTLESCPMGGAVGFVVEPMNAYYPQRDYYHRANVGHDYFKWICERDWFWNMLWGRLAYDPETPDGAWIGEFVKRFGERGGPRVYDLMCEMSQIVPLIYQSHCLGPDHRNMACELETGGDVAAFAHGQPFDTFVMQSPSEFVSRQITGKPTAKQSPLEAADALERIGKQVLQRIGAVRPAVQSGEKEFECIALDAEAVAHLAQYYAEKLRSGVAYAFYEATGDITQIEEAAGRAASAKQAWQQLAGVTIKHYRPFLDTLRMHSVAYHWITEGAKLEKDAPLLDEARKRFAESVPGAEEPILIAHTPAQRAYTGRPFDISATIATQAKQVYAVLSYRQSGGSYTQVRMIKSKTQDHVYRTHIGSSWTPGKRLEYFIEVSVGKKYARYPARGEQDPFSILITDDKQGPTITIDRTELRNMAQGMKELSLAARVSDKGRVQMVLLWHKPLPSEADWRSAPMQEQDGVYAARLPVRSDGLLYAIEALDDSGNGTRYPDFRVARPYLVVEPWQGPSAGGDQDATGLKDLARRDLSPERYAAMLIGAQAKTFNAVPTEGKKTLLDHVAQGLSLVIFSQNAPKEFDLSWLPGNVGASGEGYRVCRLTGTGPLLEGVQRELKIAGLISIGLTGGDKDWKSYSDPKALAVCKLGKGVIILCQVRVLDLLHNIMTYRLFENALTVAAGDRAGKPFVIMDIGNGKLVQGLELVGRPYVMLNELALLPAPPAQAAPTPAKATEAPPSTPSPAKTTGKAKKGGK